MMPGSLRSENLPWLGCCMRHDRSEVDKPERRLGLAILSTLKLLFEKAATLLDRGLYAESEGYFREVLRLLPDHASALNNLGTAIWRQGRVHEAEECYRRALVHDPNDFAILNNLGNVLWEQGRLDEAVRWFRPAVALRPDSPVVLMNLGVTLSDLGAFDEALGFIRESLRLLPDSPESHVNLGNTLARQGNLDAALACYEHALRLRPDFPVARRYRAYLWLARGDYERGWPEHEWRLKCAKPRVLAVNSPRWTGDELQGRSILLVAEQGLGDVLQFIRFAPPVKQRGGRVVLACPDPMIRLVSRCPGVDLVVDWNSTLPDCDVHVHLMSLPVILGTTLDSIPGEPYLSVDAQAVEDWRPIVARALSQGEPCGLVDGKNTARALHNRHRLARESGQHSRPVAFVSAHSIRSPRQAARSSSHQPADG